MARAIAQKPEPVLASEREARASLRPPNRLERLERVLRAFGRLVRLNSSGACRGRVLGQLGSRPAFASFHRFHIFCLIFFIFDGSDAF